MGMETITISRAEYERLTTQVAALQQENNWLIEQIRLAQATLWCIQRKDCCRGWLRAAELSV